MKKQSLLLLAAGMLTFAACNSGNQGGTPSQATIDSMVNVRVMELQTQMQAKNDSIINALATAKADSMMAAMKGGAPEARATHRVSHPEATHQESNTIGNGKPKMGDQKNQNSNTIGNGKPKIGDQKNQNSNTIGNGKPKIGK